MKPAEKLLQMKVFTDSPSEELQQVEVSKELTAHEKIMILIKKIETQVEEKIPFSKKRRAS